jgi:hypothetical protein
VDLAGRAVSLSAGRDWYACQLDTYVCAPRATPPTPGRNQVVSPDGKRSAFIREHDLWDARARDRQGDAAHHDGVEDHGYATDNAGWTRSERPVLRWSPDSRRIATFATTRGASA